MDPNANLAEQRRLVTRIILGEYRCRGDGDADRDRLADLVEALDEWLTRGGFLPDAWTR